MPPPAKPLRIGLLGCGAINSNVASVINSGGAGPASVGAVLVRRERSEEELQTIAPSSPDCVTTDEDAFYAADWTLCIEAAGQPAVVAHGKRCLELGRDFMVTSIGALTDAALYDELQAVAEANGSRLILCTGSMPAVDWMGAAAMCALASPSTCVTMCTRACCGQPHHVCACGCGAC
jgi:aspartate dehydrogenase